MTSSLEISAQDAARRIAERPAALLLDCREPHERQAAHLPGSLFIPMGELPSRIKELSSFQDDELIVYCHLGVRSLMVAEFLRVRGFERARSMAGGMEAWLAEVNFPKGQST